MKYAVVVDDVVVNYTVGGGVAVNYPVAVGVDVVVNCAVVVDDVAVSYAVGVDVVAAAVAVSVFLAFARGSRMPQFFFP